MWENFFKHVDVLPENVCSWHSSALVCTSKPSRSFDRESALVPPLIYDCRCISWTEMLVTANLQHCKRNAGGNFSIRNAPDCFYVDGTAAMSSASRRTVASKFSSPESVMTVTLHSMNRVPTHANQPLCALCVL
jgi:hypothetical protein